ncbi:MAG: hypothetical protein AB2L24_16650 [Mangrovibacterium sp.]
MKKLKFIIKPTLVLSFFALFFSCEDEPEITPALSRLFKPVSFATAINGNTISFNWTPIAGATYSLEISRDSLEFVNDLQVFPVRGNDTVIGDLWSQARYSARIKAVSKNPLTKDSNYKQVTFKTGTENIFYEVPGDDTGMNSVLLKWNNNKEVSHIVVSAEGVDNIAVNLSSADISSGEKLIEGLNAGTAYTFRIYLGEMLRGTLTVTTRNN